MASGFEAIRLAITSVLSPLTVGAGRALNATYPYLTEKPTSFPCVIFDVSDTENTFLTNQSNRREYTWQLYILDLIPQGRTLEDATNRMDKTADAVVDAFENDITLGGVVDWCQPLTGGREQVETPQGYALMQTLTLTAVVGTECLTGD